MGKAADNPGLQFDTEHMRAGANRSYTAADQAEEARKALHQANVGTSIFGDFAGAESFHSAVTRAHGHHVQTAGGSRDALGGLGDTTHEIARTFDDMEVRNTELVKRVR